MSFILFSNNIHYGLQVFNWMQLENLQEYKTVRVLRHIFCFGRKKISLTSLNSWGKAPTLGKPQGRTSNL